MRTIILLIYWNIIFSQYNILQYSCVTIQYIAIFVNTNRRVWIQYIAIFLSDDTIYCIVMTNQYNILSGIYCNWFIFIGVQIILPCTPICTYGAVLLLDVQYIVQYIAIIVWDNTIYCNIRCHQYNTLQYSSPRIQYIAIFVTRNTIYCIVRTQQYNISQYIVIQYIVAHPCYGVSYTWRPDKQQQKLFNTGYCTTVKKRKVSTSAALTLDSIRV
jgi:hypothetical protein